MRGHHVLAELPGGLLLGLGVLGGHDPQRVAADRGAGVLVRVVVRELGNGHVLGGAVGQHGGVGGGGGQHDADLVGGEGGRHRTGIGAGVERDAVLEHVGDLLEHVELGRGGHVHAGDGLAAAAVAGGGDELAVAGGEFLQDPRVDHVHREAVGAGLLMDGVGPVDDLGEGGRRVGHVQAGLLGEFVVDVGHGLADGERQGQQAVVVAVVLQRDRLQVGRIEVGVALSELVDRGGHLAVDHVAGRGVVHLQDRGRGLGLDGGGELLLHVRVGALIGGLDLDLALVGVVELGDELVDGVHGRAGVRVPERDVLLAAVRIGVRVRRGAAGGQCEHG